MVVHVTLHDSLGPRRDMVRAAALLIAEIERMDRTKPANYEETEASRTEIELGSAASGGTEQ